MFFLAKIRILLACLLLFVLLTPVGLQAKSTWDYPRTLNYFLDTYLHPDEGKLLAKWDVLVLSAATQEWRPEVFQTIRQANPDVIILAYISVTGVVDQEISDGFSRFQPLSASQIPDEWWLKSSSQARLGYWPGSKMLNVTDHSPIATNTDKTDKRWNEWFPDFVADNIYSTGYWDGIFLDEAFAEISWINKGDIDLDGDGLAETKEKINSSLRSGIDKITRQLRERIGPSAYIVVNGSNQYAAHTNGRMHENVFDEPHQWTSEMDSYLVAPGAFKPNLSLVNVNTGNSGIINHQNQLFGLTSTLLGDGFFSYDHGDQMHMNIWWSDEYDKYLGAPLSPANNLLSRDNTLQSAREKTQAVQNSNQFEPGLWRRDFTHGAVLVNSTAEELTYAIGLGGKLTSGSINPYSGKILTFDQFQQDSQPLVQFDVDNSELTDADRLTSKSNKPVSSQAGSAGVPAITQVNRFQDTLILGPQSEADQFLSNAPDNTTPLYADSPPDELKKSVSVEAVDLGSDLFDMKIIYQEFNNESSQNRGLGFFQQLIHKDSFAGQLISQFIKIKAFLQSILEF